MRNTKSSAIPPSFHHVDSRHDLQDTPGRFKNSEI